MYRVSGHRARILDVSISDIFISVVFDRKYTAAHIILDDEAVNSLQILSEKYQDSNQSILFPMFDARRMEVYVMVLNEKKEILKPSFAEVLSAESFNEFPTDVQWIFMGEGAEKCKQVFDAPQIEYRSDIRYPSAAEMVSLAWKAFQDKNFEDVAYFEPFYLKDFYTTAKKIGE